MEPVRLDELIPDDRCEEENRGNLEIEKKNNETQSAKTHGKDAKKIPTKNLVHCLNQKLDCQFPQQKPIRLSNWPKKNKI